jgi:hypothetical protein
MEVTLALLADAANISTDGKLNILGVFNALGGHTFPVVHPQMALVLRFEASHAEAGKARRLELQLSDGDGGKLFRIDAQLVVPKGAPGMPIRLDHILMLHGIQFPKPGDYVFNVLVGDDQKAAIDLRLIQVQMPTQPPGPDPRNPLTPPTPPYA